VALLLRDSDDPYAIPLDGLAAVAGYGDGRAVWSSEAWARFPRSVVPLSIVLDARHQGDILDVERGAATPSDCPGWWDRFRRPARRRPSIYCNRATIEDVRRALAGRPIDWWEATLDGTLGWEGAVAVQLLGAADSHDPARTSGHFDESIILDPGWIGIEVPQVHQTGGAPGFPTPNWWTAGAG
jgi:hypothetical protein